MALDQPLRAALYTATTGALLVGAVSGALIVALSELLRANTADLTFIALAAALWIGALFVGWTRYIKPAIDLAGGRLSVVWETAAFFAGIGCSALLLLVTLQRGLSGYGTYAMLAFGVVVIGIGSFLLEFVRRWWLARYDGNRS